MQAVIAGPCGLVQVIKLSWDKSARGDKGARDRNSVPTAFVVSADELMDAGGCLCVSISHWGNNDAFAESFVTTSERFAIADGYTIGCVNILPHHDGLAVTYCYNERAGGAPGRWYYDSSTGTRTPVARSLVVGVGQWASVSYNGRFSCIDSGNWWYEQTTINVAWFDGVPDGHVFVDRKPTTELRLLADLW